MNIQARKLNLIENLLKISDVSVIEKLEYFISIEKNNQYDRTLKPMSLNDFYEMIEKAKQDKIEGRVISLDDLKKKIKSWK